jgi:hypothetical protein
MSDESPIDEEYEPADIDPDAPIAASPARAEPPVDADPADWMDQLREVPVDDEDHDAPE